MHGIEIDIREFPTTRYQGSKRKIIPWLHQIFKDLTFETPLDAFGGSGAVSYLFKKMNKSVTYNDVLKFNHTIGKAIIENQSFKITTDDIQYLIGNNAGHSCGNFIYNNFKDVYYLDEENQWLDKVISNIINWNLYEPIEQSFKKNLAYYALFQASLVKRPYNLFHRKNLSIRLSDVERSFGNKTTWDTSFEIHFNNFISEANKHVFNSGKKCESTNLSVFDIDVDNKHHDLVYLDPPYLNLKKTNESVDYLNCYHFLEGICKYEDWHLMIDYEAKNLKFKGDYNLDYFKKNRVTETYERLFQMFQKSIIVLSYKEGGTPSIEFLMHTMRKFKSKVYSFSKHYKYALNKQNGNAEKNREVIIIGF